MSGTALRGAAALATHAALLRSADGSISLETRLRSGKCVPGDALGRCTNRVPCSCVAAIRARPCAPVAPQPPTQSHLCVIIGGVSVLVVFQIPRKGKSQQVRLAPEREVGAVDLEVHTGHTDVGNVDFDDDMRVRLRHLKPRCHWHVPRPERRVSA